MIMLSDMTGKVFSSDKSHFDPRLSSYTLSQAKGRVVVPNGMNFRKSSKGWRGGRVIFNPKIYNLLRNEGLKIVVQCLSFGNHRLVV